MNRVLEIFSGDNKQYRMAEDIMGKFYTCLNLRLEDKLFELTKIIDQSSPTKELQALFPQLVNNIFASSISSGWNLKTVTCDNSRGMRPEFEALMSFLEPQGPMFRLCYKLMCDQQLKYDLPLSVLPLDLQMSLERGRCPQFYTDLLVVDTQTMNFVALALNPFDYYIFNFALHLVNNSQQQRTWENWNSVYFALACDYLMHFLPSDPNMPVLPHIPNYTGKVAMAAPLQTANRPLHTPSLLLIPDLCGMSNQHTSPQTQSRNEVWRSETILQVFVDIWMSVEHFDPRDVDLFQRGYPTMCSTPERVRTVRVLIKHIHSYSAKHLADSATRSSALRKYARQIMCARAYHYVKHLVQTWPLDASFRLVLELWLSLIQPWRYTDNAINQERFGHNNNHDENASVLDSSYTQFIAENFPSYTCILQLVLPRFLRMDLTVYKNAVMLFRVGKVFSQQHLVPVLWNLEQAMTDGGTSFLNPNDSYNNSTHDQSYTYNGVSLHKWVTIAKQAITELNMCTTFEYDPVWADHKTNFVIEFIRKIQSAKTAAEITAEHYGKKMRERQIGIWKSIKCWLMINDPMEEELILEEYKKVPVYLNTCIHFLSRINARFIVHRHWTSSKEKYTEFIKRRSSNVWDHFHRSDDGQTAKCQICSKKLKTTGGSTTGLHTHLRTVHSNISGLCDSTEEAASMASSVTPSTSTSQDQSTKLKKRKLMTDYFKSSESMEVVVSRMTALDGVSFRLFSESQDLRLLFKKSGYDIPKTSNTIAKIVLEHSKQVKSEVINTITVMKQNGERFTLSLDEWTSLRNRRYMNMNLHCRAFGGFQFKNLGLIKITGSLTATATLSLMREHLAKFNIVLEEDIISQTTDGASVMKKMGSYIPCHHQLCLAHGIQLAVIDTLYKPTATAEVELEPLLQYELEPAHSSDSESDVDQDLSGFEVESPRSRTADPRLYKEVISKVRRLVKSIKKSPLKADALRAYVSKEFGENIQLQLDCRTRWSSMSDMIGSFLKMKDCIFKLLIDIKSEISFTDIEIQTLTDIHNNLEVVKMTVLTICRREATLYIADTALKFMLNKLLQQKTHLSSSLAVNLRRRIKERRLLIAGVLHYLHDSKSFYSASADDDNDTFAKPTGNQICDVIVSILKRLKYKENPSSTVAATEIESTTDTLLSDDEDDVPLSSLASTSKLTLQEEFEKEMEKCKVKKSIVPSSDEFDLSGFVMTEKAIYDNGGERGIYLTQAYTYLSSILPTSVESERVFSSAGYFCNKIRSSLSDKMLDALVFLRTHYQEKRAFKK